MVNPDMTIYLLPVWQEIQNDVFAKSFQSVCKPENYYSNELSGPCYHYTELSRNYTTCKM